MSKSSMTHKPRNPFRRAPSARTVLFSAGLVFALAGGLTACGSSAAKTSTAASGAGASDAAAPSGSGGTSPATVKATGGGDFCKLIASSFNSAAAGVAQNGTSPAAMKKLYENVDSQYQSAVDAAPSAIKSDVEVIGAATAKLTAALADANYDMSKLAPGATAVFATPTVMAASTHVLAYVKDQCGIDLTSTAAASATTAP